MAATQSGRIYAMAMLIMLFGLPATCSFANTNDLNRYRSIDSLITERKVFARLTSTGFYSGYSVEADLINQTTETVYLLIEAGRRLIATDSSKQDIFIVKENKVILAPMARVTVRVYGFCCQSSDGAPTVGMGFHLGYIAPDHWVRLARFINTSSEIDPGAIQAAVWVLSNQHCISSIHGSPSAKVEVLKDTVAAILQIKVPWYSIEYEMKEGMVFSGVPRKIYGKVSYYVKHHASVVMVIKDKKGNTIKTLTESGRSGEGRYESDLAITVKGWPKGAYNIMVYEDHANLIMTKEFVLE